MQKVSHSSKVQTISSQMKYFYKQEKKVRIYHGTTTSTRTQNFKKGEIIDVSKLNEVILIDKKRRYAIVEPNVPMDKLIQASLKQNLVPPVVMELPGITVGGGIQGGAGESSSFKYGGFHETCFEYEIVLGNGEIITCSSKNNSDLYWGIPCSYGSLAIITKIKIKLIPAKKFVRLICIRTESFSNAVSLIEKLIQEPIDFIESIFFSKNLGIVVVGILSDMEDLPIKRFTRPFDDWYYLHLRKVIHKHKKYEELIPLKDYLFRYNRGTFWTGEYVFNLLGIPFNRLTRFLFDPMLKSKTASRFLQAINISQRFIVQDICFPKKNVAAFLNFTNEKIGMYPLVFGPGKNSKDNKLSPIFLQTKDLVFSVGLYAKLSEDYFQAVNLNRRIEKIVKKLRGRKWLYAHQYYLEEEFWKIYDKKWYDKLRKKYKAEKVFPDIYEKTHVSRKYEVSILKGLLNILKSPFKLRVS